MDWSGTTTCPGAISWRKLPNALMLSARGLNIVAPRPAHVNLHTGIVQDLLKARDLRVRRSEIGGTGMRIERNDVDFAANPLEKLGKLARVLLGVIDSAQQNVLERDALASWNRQRPAAIEQLG